MARLIPNPLSDLADPLGRVERGLDSVQSSLSPLDGMGQDIAAVRGTLDLLLEEIRALRSDLAAAQAGAGIPAAPG